MMDQKEKIIEYIRSISKDLRIKKISGQPFTPYLSQIHFEILYRTIIDNLSEEDAKFDKEVIDTAIAFVVFAPLHEAKNEELIAEFSSILVEYPNAGSLWELGIAYGCGWKRSTTQDWPKAEQGLQHIFYDKLRDIDNNWFAQHVPEFPRRKMEGPSPSSEEKNIEVLTNAIELTTRMIKPEEERCLVEGAALSILPGKANYTIRIFDSIEDNLTTPKKYRLVGEGRIAYHTNNPSRRIRTDDEIEIVEEDGYIKISRNGKLFKELSSPGDKILIGSSSEKLVLYATHTETDLDEVFEEFTIERGDTFQLPLDMIFPQTFRFVGKGQLSIDTDKTLYHLESEDVLKFTSRHEDGLTLASVNNKLIHVFESEKDKFTVNSTTKKLIISPVYNEKILKQDETAQIEFEDIKRSASVTSIDTPDQISEQSADYDLVSNISTGDTRCYVFTSGEGALQINAHQPITFPLREGSRLIIHSQSGHVAIYYQQGTLTDCGWVFIPSRPHEGLPDPIRLDRDSHYAVLTATTQLTYIEKVARCHASDSDRLHRLEYWDPRTDEQSPTFDTFLSATSLRIGNLKSNLYNDFKTNSLYWPLLSSEIIESRYRIYYGKIATEYCLHRINDQPCGTVLYFNSARCDHDQCGALRDMHRLQLNIADGFVCIEDGFPDPLYKRRHLYHCTNCPSNERCGLIIKGKKNAGHDTYYGTYIDPTDITLDEIGNLKCPLPGNADLGNNTTIVWVQERSKKSQNHESTSDDDDEGWKINQ